MCEAPLFRTCLPLKSGLEMQKALVAVFTLLSYNVLAVIADCSLPDAPTDALIVQAADLQTGVDLGSVVLEGRLHPIPGTDGSSFFVKVRVLDHSQCLPEAFRCVLYTFGTVICSNTLS